MNLYSYVNRNSIRGACNCGKCADAVSDPKLEQPKTHTVDLTFFKVGNVGATKEEFEKLVKEEFPNWLDGKEHSYLEVGGDLGDQGTALCCIGLGHILGLWKALSPETVFPFLDLNTKMNMAEKGLVCLKF